MPHLVTSQQAQDHIRDFNDARYNAGIVGNGFYLLQGQGNMEATMVNSNTLRIMSGDAIANGRHWSIDDSYEEYTIENGTPGYKRIDLAVAHIETMPKATIEIRILKGEEATGTPEKPSYIEGDLNDGDTVIEVPICSVLIDGINPGEPVSEMMILMSYDEFRKKTADDMKELRDSLSRNNPRQQLWAGEFASGSITVPGISNYNVLLIRCQNVWGMASVGNAGRVIGGSVYLANNISHRLEIELNILGDTLTYVRALEIRGGSINLDKLVINEIVGLF